MMTFIQRNLKAINHHLKRTLFRNAYVMMAGTITNSVLGFIFWMIVTKLYSADAIGLNFSIISSAGLLAIFSELGLGIGLIRFLPKAGKKSNDMLNTCLTLSGLASIAFALIFLLGLGYWSPALLILEQDHAFSIGFVILTVITTLRTPIINTFMAKLDSKFQFISRFISGLVKLPAAILFAFFLNNAFGLFISIIFAGALDLVLSVGWLLPKVLSGYYPFPKIKREVVGELWHYSISNYISRGLLQLTPVILPLMVVNILSAEMTAYFAIVWSIFQLILVIPSSIFNSLFAEGSNDETSLRTNGLKPLKLMLLLLLPVVVLILLTADKLLLLFGQAYSNNGTLLLRIIVLSAIPYGINYYYISIARINKNTINIIKITIVTTCLCLGLGYFLMIKMSLVGMGLGYLVAQSIAAISVLILLRRGDVYS